MAINGSQQHGYVDGLRALLAQSCEPSTSRIQAATAALNQNYYKSPSCVGALVQVIATTPEVSIRQLAAIELRKRVTKHWKKVRAQEKVAVKHQLLELVLAESARKVRHAIAQSIAALAEIEFMAQSWGELLQFVYQACRSDDSTHREMGFYLLLTLYDTIAAGLESHSDFLYQIYAAGLQDPTSLEVRYTSVSILGKVAEYLEPTDKAGIRNYQNLLPAMVNVLSQCLGSRNEEGAKKCYDVFETLLILDVPLISKYMKELVEFFVATARNTAYESDSRTQALTFIMWATKYKASKFSALKLIAPVIEALLRIGAEDDIEDDDDDEDSPSKVACRVIDMLATSLPPQQFFPPLMEHVTRYCGSDDPGHRKAGMMALAVSLEGCSDYVAPQFDQCLEFISRGLQDPDARVRKAACIALSCLAEELSDEVATRHATLLPIITPLIGLADEIFAKQAIIALDAILESLGKEILPYLHSLMERLIPMLDQAPMKLKPALIASIGSCAHASKQDFKPYFAETFQRLLACMRFTQPDQEFIDCKGVAIDTIGTLAEAVGKDLFSAHAQEVIPLAFAGLDDGNPKLRECCFVFFAVMTRVYGEDFSQFLPRLMPVLMTALKQAEDVETLYDEADLSTNAKADDEDDIRDDADEMAKVSSAIAFEKEVAADAIREIFTHTKSQFLPYLEETTKAMLELLGHYYEGARKSAALALLGSVKVLYEIESIDRWEAGLENIRPLPSNVSALATTVVPEVLEHLESDDDKGVVYEVLSDLADTLNTCGPALLPAYFQRIGQAVIAILQKKAFCQRIDEGDEAELDEDAAAQVDSDLIAGAGEVIGSIALVSGADGVQAFRMFFPQLVKYYKKERSKIERQTVIGTCSDVIVGLGSAVEEFTSSLLQLIIQALDDEDFDVRSNAAFGLGVLVEHAPQDLSARFLEFLSALQPLFGEFVAANATDNAVGAVSRLIVKSPHAVPLEQVLPVILAVCPLQKDFRENQPLVKAVITLLDSNTPVLVQNPAHMAKVIQILHSAMTEDAEENLNQETREKIVQVVMALKQSPEYSALIAQTSLSTIQL